MRQYTCCLALATLCASFPLSAAESLPGFDACLAALQRDAPARGVTIETFRTHAASITPDPKVVELLDYQPEFRTPVWDYLAALVDDERIVDGKRMQEQWAETLAGVSAEYGIPTAVVLAVWGVESNYGRNFGKRPLLNSLATLSCFGRRQSYFRKEFFTTLKILQEGHVDATQLTGSWAGAFGHTQFMPSTFMRVAIDFDRDGRRDLIGSVPDALASTANFLNDAGWEIGLPWGWEVSLPSGYEGRDAGRRAKKPLSQWTALGIRLANGQPLPELPAAAGLLLPAGPTGPAFLVTRNFDALFAYNAAESYALAIAHLADRLRDAPAFVTPWPTDDPGLSRAERREVQQHLVRLGYNVGEIDGLIGDGTRRLIAEYQTSKGLPADGRAGRKLLEGLRADTSR